MKIKLFTSSFMLLGLFVAAQLPYISTPTIIPQNPTNTSIIKVVTKVTTPNQGIIVDPNVFFHLGGNTVWIRGCYWNGMLTSPQSYIDTITIGQLSVGNYQFAQIARLSSTQQHCSIIDSNVVFLNLQVTQATNLNEMINNKSIKVYPSPCTNKLIIEGVGENVELSIYSLDGKLVKNTFQTNDAIDVAYLPDAIYVLRIREINSKQQQFLKFVKRAEVD